MADFAKAGPISHGGSLAEAARLFADAPRPFIDLSTGINPEPYPMPPLAAEHFSRLPEPEALRELEAIAAAAYGVPNPAMVVAAPGTQILISLLPRLFPQPDIAVLGPTYAEHAAAWAGQGTHVHHATDLRHLARSGAAVLCNPNNPDGRRTDPAAIAALAQRLRLVVIDEAFADLEPPSLSAAGFLGPPSLVILRSFGKSYGLAGIRLGFALASPDAAALIRSALGPWAVSGAAIEGGRRALADAPWRNATIGRLDNDVVRLDAALQAAGFSEVTGTRLFRLVKSPDAPVHFETLGRAGVVVRRFADHPDWLRFGVPAHVQWDRVEKALRGIAGC